MKIQLQFNENASVSNIIYSSVVESSDHSSRESQMETDEIHEIHLDEFVIENDLPAFLFLVLDKCFVCQATDASHIQAQFVVVDKTVS